MKIPPTSIIHTVINVGRRRVGAGDDGVTSTRVGLLNVVGNGITRTPVLVVEGGELASHVGGGSWLSAKVDSELPGPIAFLYTQDARLLPSIADWLRLSWSSDGPME